jgi:hypothetical protein
MHVSAKKEHFFDICCDLGDVSFVIYRTFGLSNVLLARKGAEMLTNEDLVSLPLDWPKGFRQDF